MMPDTVRVLREIKDHDMYIGIRLKKLGDYVKKIDDCCCGRFSWTKIKLYFVALVYLLPRAKIIIIIMVAITSDGIEFQDDLGSRVTQVTDDNREKAFLYQRLSVVIQRYNAAILGTFVHATPEDEF